MDRYSPSRAMLGIRRGPGVALRKGLNISIFSANGAAICLLIIALCYKFFAVGVVILLLLSANIWLFRKHLDKINPTILLAMLFIADATVSAFFVSRASGLARTVQFMVVAGAMTGMFLYSWELDKEKIWKILKAIFLVIVAILVHVIIYHIISGRLTTWKYLYDTKLVFCLLVFITFAMKDRLEQKPFMFPLLLILAAMVCVLSGERKSLLLFVILFAISNIGIGGKLLTVAAGVMGFAAMNLLQLGTPLVEQRVSISSSAHAELPDRYFYTVNSLGDQSDLVREFVNRNARRLFAQNPIFGIGATGYSQWAARQFPSDQGMTMNVHGEVNRIPAEGGLVGIVIALSFLAATGYRTVVHAFMSGGSRRTSLQSSPLYLFVYLICYCYSEVIGTHMLVLIGITGIVAARLPMLSLRDLLDRNRGRSPAAAIKIHSGILRKRVLLMTHRSNSLRRRILLDSARTMQRESP